MKTLGASWKRLGSVNLQVGITGAPTFSRQEVSLRASQRHLVDYGAVALRGLLLSEIFGWVVEYEIGVFFYISWVVG